MNNVIFRSVSILGKDCTAGHKTGFMAAFVLCYFLETVLGKNTV